MKVRNNGAGFTLIELLIVSVLLSVVSLAIYTSFANGLKVWKRVNTPIEDEDTVLFFERLGAELRNAVVLEDIRFQGTERGFEIPLVILSKRMKVRTVGKVVYSFDSGLGAITRAAVDFSGMFTGSSPSPVAVLRNVRQARCSFYRYDHETRRYEWLDTWMSDKPPLAVRVEIQRAGSSEQDPVQRTFSIPVSRKTNEEG